MPEAWTALALTLKVALWATALNLVLGVAVGFAMARARFPGRELLDAVLTLPMVMPPTVLGYYLLVLIGSQGVVGAFLLEQFGIRLIFTWQAAIGKPQDRNRSGVFGSWSALRSTETG